VVSGYVVDTALDLAMPGAIPLVWTRKYSSGRRGDKDATLGPGWAHGFEQRLTEGERVITLREAEGRSVHFEKIKPGESTFHRRERMTLLRESEASYRISQLDTRLTYAFSAARAGGPALLRSIRDAWDNTIALEYDGERLSRIIDTAGREVTLLWKQSRIVRLEVRAEGRLEQWVDYAYSAAGDLLSATDALGHAEQYEYDRFHRMIAATLKTGVRFEYEYEPDTGRCLKTWGPNGLYAIELHADKATRTTHVAGEEPRVITWSELGVATREALPDGTVLVERAYDDDGLLVAEVNGAGEGTQRWYDDRGNLLRSVDAAGNVTAFDHEHDRPVKSVTSDGLVKQMSYDGKGTLTGVSLPTGQTYSFSYDERGRLSAIHCGGSLFRAFEHDGQHNLIAETDARGARTTYAYDAMGRPLVRKDALGRVTRAAYDRLGQRISLRAPDATTTQLAYDERGKVTRVTDALGRVTRFEYAGMGVITRMIQSDGQAWSFKYTSKERLKEIKNPRGESYAFGYDDAGRVITEQTFDGRRLTYRWSVAGRLERLEHPDGSFRAFSYDRLGKMIGEQTPDCTITCQRDRLGRLLGATLRDPEASVATLFERDAFGRVVSEAQGDRRVRFTYDADGRRVTRILPNGATTRYAYDAGDALRAIEHDGHTLLLERDALGRETGRAAADGRFTVRSAYDEADRLIEQRVVAPAPGGGVPAILVQRQWQYDAVGRVKQIDDGRWGKTTYRYDGLGRLVEARRGDLREAFTYDAAGTLQSMLEALDGRGTAEPHERAAGGLVTRTASAKYTYDARARRVVKLDLRRRGEGGEALATEYGWDSRDRLRRVRLPDGTQLRFTYDAFGRRVRKEVQGAGQASARVVELVWDGDALAAEHDSERGVRCFVHAPDSMAPLLQQEQGEVLIYVNDHLGTPKELIDGAGLVAWSAAHSAWGKIVATHADPLRAATRARPVDSPFRLLGQVADEETGLCCTKFRYFDPELGRWCSPDPLGFNGGKDLFGFDGSPTTDVDPLGLEGAHPPPPLPKDPEQLKKEGWTETTHPGLAAAGKREFTDPNTGMKVAFHPGTPGEPGFGGKDHYHVYNPDSTGKGNLYLDKDGNPTAKNSKPSHIFPSR
jgi:RHS repeat-associated protein